MTNLIKARVIKNESSECDVCGAQKDKVLDMFDFKVGNVLLHICDLCMEDILSKSLKCVCYVNGRLKQPHDMAVIRTRGSKWSWMVDKARQEQEEYKKRKAEEEAWEEAIKYDPNKPKRGKRKK